MGFRGFCFFFRFWGLDGFNYFMDWVIGSKPPAPSGKDQV